MEWKKTCESLLNCKEERRLVFLKKGYPVLECKQCGHRFTELKNADNHLQEVYSDDYFFSGNGGYANYLEEKDLLIGSGRAYAKLMAKYTRPGEIFEVGSAAGFLLKGFEMEGWKCHGIEPNDKIARFGRDELKLDISTGDFENFDSNTKYDLITLIQVIGHFHDLDKAMRNVSRLINSEGFVLVESWDMKSLVARVFGKNWHEYCPPSVIHWYSHQTLVQLFNYYGFELVSKGRPVKRILFHHAIAVLEESTPNIFFKKRILDFMSKKFGKATVRYPSFDLNWYIFKKSGKQKI